MLATDSVEGNDGASDAMCEKDSAALLLAAALAGNQQRWWQIVDQYTPMLRRTATDFRIGADTEDAIQNTFLHLFQSGDTIKKPEALAGWLVTTMRNECLAILRRRKKVQLARDDDVWDLLVAEVPGMDDVIIGQEQARIVRQALGRIHPRHRQLLELLDDPATKSYAHVSQSLGMPIGSIGPTRQRVLRRLHRDLQDAAVDRCA